MCIRDSGSTIGDVLRGADPVAHVEVARDLEPVRERIGERRARDERVEIDDRRVIGRAAKKRRAEALVVLFSVLLGNLEAQRALVEGVRGTGSKQPARSVVRHAGKRRRYPCRDAHHGGKNCRQVASAKTPLHHRTDSFLTITGEIPGVSAKTFPTVTPPSRARGAIIRCRGRRLSAIRALSLPARSPAPACSRRHSSCAARRAPCRGTRFRARTCSPGCGCEASRSCRSKSAPARGHVRSFPKRDWEAFPSAAWRRTGTSPPAGEKEFRREMN